jgi:hypothetical protein
MKHYLLALAATGAQAAKAGTCESVKVVVTAKR